jgi:hypothetical protein
MGLIGRRRYKSAVLPGKNRVFFVTGCIDFVDEFTADGFPTVRRSPKQFSDLAW